MIVLVSFFCHCDKMPKINNSKGRKVHFNSWFQRFEGTVNWLVTLGPVERWHIIAGVLKVLTSQWPGSREREGVRIPINPSRSQS